MTPGSAAAAAPGRQPGGEVPAFAPESLPPLQLPADVFEAATVPPAPVAPAVLDQVAGSLLQARRDVDDYVVGMAVLDRNSQTALQAVDQLRHVLEEVYGTAVTFRGEQRPARTATRVSARKIGVVLSGNANVTGDIAGRDINKND